MECAETKKDFTQQNVPSSHPTSIIQFQSFCQIHTITSSYSSWSFALVLLSDSVFLILSWRCCPLSSAAPKASTLRHRKFFCSLFREHWFLFATHQVSFRLSARLRMHKSDVSWLADQLYDWITRRRIRPNQSIVEESKPLKGWTEL